MNKLSAKKWIISFFAIVLVFVIILSTVAYIVDPFFQFRTRENSYMLSGWSVSSGLIENYDYDTLIIGSSMIQNFDMDLFREKLGVNPLHIGLGGMYRCELQQFMDLAYDANKAENFYVCVDLSMFTDEYTESRYPEYLLKKDILSRLRYLLSYEVWFAYLPVDIGLVLAEQMGVKFPDKFEYSRSIDKLEDWRLDYEFGEDIVIDNYINRRFDVSEVDVENLYERMTEEIDRYLEKFMFEKGEHTFFFPPYSALYWYSAQERGYYDEYMLAKQYFVEKAEAYGATVYDFQCAEFISDLDKYKDFTHYRPEINDWMVECFANQEYLLTPDNCAAFTEKLTEITNDFRAKYAGVID